MGEPPAPDDSGQVGPADYLVSVSDLMSGLIFLFIIALIIFAFSYKRYARELTNTEDVRRTLVSEIAQSMKDAGIRVEIDEDHGILRLPEEILFPLGSAELTGEGKNAIHVLALNMSQILPCYAGQRDRPREPMCAQWHPGRLDAVFLEGHTDDIPVREGGVFRSNWELSAARAINTYQELRLAATESPLDRILNSNGEPVLGVSGYAEFRPVQRNVDDNSRRRNRRIDIRFVMTPPRSGAGPRPQVQESTHPLESTKSHAPA